MKQKLKTCGSCSKETILWKSKSRDEDGNIIPGLCKDCAMSFDTNTLQRKLKPVQKRIKPAKRKATGEYALFLKIFSERKGMCQVTGKQIPFNVNNFAHILSKGAYPRFRLNPDNIIHVSPEIHHLYDNSSKENLLEKYPEAGIIYTLKDQLRHKYYNS